jgi:serine phosphatase RsbU (regulator of sigma subunit)
MDGRSPPLGVRTAAAPRIEAATDLPAGTRLLLYTDGLVERRRESIDDGIARLVAAVASRTALSARALVEEVPDGVIPRGGTDDDVCLLCLHLLRPARPRHPPP